MTAEHAAERPPLHGIGWLVLALTLVLGGWLTFDGTRALVAGDYVTPATGPYAGKLGPWAGIVSAAGLAPRSSIMKVIHVALGVAWLVAGVAFLRREGWARTAMLMCAVLTLWYLPFGTIASIAVIVLLLRPRFRSTLP